MNYATRFAATVIGAAGLLLCASACIPDATPCQTGATRMCYCESNDMNMSQVCSGGTWGACMCPAGHAAGSGGGGASGTTASSAGMTAGSAGTTAGSAGTTAGTTAGSAGTSAGSSAGSGGAAGSMMTDGGSDLGDGAVSDVDAGPATYSGPCTTTAGSCPTDQVCQMSGGGLAGAAYSYCGKVCTAVGDCPAANGGTATVACMAPLLPLSPSYCGLSCAGGLTCPTGMECNTANVCGFKM